MIAWARTLAFRIIFYGLSVPIVLLAPLSALFGRRATVRYAMGWTAVHRWAVRTILGIAIRVEGSPPGGAVLYAAKHQAMFETLELTLLLRGPAMVLKQELARIPVWGWVARRYGAIVIDRSAAARALRQMIAEGTAAKAAGRSVMIFPEGTRVKPGEQPPLLSGFAGLYKALGMPVVPIALDSGRLMPRHGTKHSGTITIRFTDTIPAGLARREVEARVHAAINVLENEPTPLRSGERGSVDQI